MSGQAWRMLPHRAGDKELEVVTHEGQSVCVVVTEAVKDAIAKRGGKKRRR